MESNLKLLFKFTFVLLLTFTSHAKESDIALRFVNELQLGKNLKSMGLKVSMATQTFRMVTAEVGADKAKSILNVELEKVIKKYQAEWNENLSLSYLDSFSESELLSILELKQKSPHVKKFISSQSTVGSNMRKRSDDLLNQVVAEAIKNSFTKISSKGS